MPERKRFFSVDLFPYKQEHHKRIRPDWVLIEIYLSEPGHTCVSYLYPDNHAVGGEHLIDHHLYVYEQQKVHLKIFDAIVKTCLPVYRISGPSSSFSQFSSSPSMETLSSRG